MALESASFIWQLVATNPTGSDGKDKGDDHVRMMKSCLLNTFPNIAGAITASHTEINYLAGVTSSIQTQINSLNSLKATIASPALSGTPTTPTPDGGTAAQITNVAYVGTAVAGVGTLGDLVDVGVTATGTCTVNTRELLRGTSALTRTLPSGAAVGALVGFKDDGQDFSINKLTIIPPSGHRIEWAAVDESVEVTVRGEHFAMKQTQSGVWRVL